MKRSGLSNARIAAFTLIELLVVIAIIAILAAILFPVFARARAKAQQNTCLSNTKQIALAMNMYVSDYDQYWPLFYNATCQTNANPCAGEKYSYWWDDLIPYTKNATMDACPTDSASGVGGSVGGTNDSDSLVWSGTIFVSYACNDYGLFCDGNCNTGGTKDASITQPSTTIEMYDGSSIRPTLTQANGGPGNISYRHNGNANFSFCDGHAKDLVMGTVDQNGPNLTWWNVAQ
jgi:prepilin-type N-terminal cleavage/methylation domain-containing protein/prepilin-type processing-associated H-X9-DG protein